MVELSTLLTLGVLGFIAGFVFSVPVAGPVSIIVTSQALKGQRNFALLIAVGAAVIDFLYCFVAVFGFTQLFNWYQPYIPYTLIAGSLFLVYVGYRIQKTDLDFEHFDEQNPIKLPVKKFQKRGKFFTGVMVNFLNPSLFIGWLTSSFFLLSLAASMGVNVGGLDNVLGSNVESINGHSQLAIEQALENNAPAAATPQTPLEANHQLLNSLIYALMVGLGSVAWFYLFTGFLVKNRHKIKQQHIQKIVHTLGYGVWLFALYLFYKALMIFYHPFS